MRRIVKIKPVHVKAHKSLYDIMEELNKQFKSKNGIGLSQVESTRIIAKNFRMPKIPDLLNIKRGKRCL
jgi:hypothetical protein